MFAPLLELFRDISRLWLNPDTQWIVMVLVALHALALLALNRQRADDRLFRAGNPELWQLGLLALSLGAYAAGYPRAAWTTDALVVVVAIAGGQAAKFYIVRSGTAPGVRGSRQRRLALGLIVMLVAASAWPSQETKYIYHGHVRWTGPCDNPNIFGLLMGTGLILVVGQAGRTIGQLRARQATASAGWLLGFLVLAGLSLANGWLHSYSRGAWLGTMVGLAVLLGPALAKRARLPGGYAAVMRVWLPRLVLAVVAGGVLAYWHHDPNTAVLNRVYSVANANDFSWRNRCAAAEGALQIMADHFWGGAGWNRPEPLYETYYATNPVDGGMAIQMNSFLLLGATLGVPALGAWLLYLVTSAARMVARRDLEAGWLPGAAALVVLTGFVFDGALRYLPTASLFWILWEAAAAGGGRPVLVDRDGGDKRHGIERERLADQADDLRVRAGVDQSGL